MVKKKVPDVVVTETSEYDNFVGKKESLPGTLSDVFGDDLVQENTDDKLWKKHWVGMPEYSQDDNPTYKTLYVHFRSEEDYRAFGKLINQNISVKTKSIWYPKLDRVKNALMRWIEEE